MYIIPPCRAVVKENFPKKSQKRMVLPAMKAINLRKSLPDFLIMTLGTLLVAVGVYFFKIPNGFSIGGVSGIATLLGRVIPVITPATLVAILNVLLLIVGIFAIGRETGARTVYCSLAFSAFSWLFGRLIPLDGPLTDQPFLELCYAILLSGIGSALLFRQGASSGGTDIVALILKKYTALDTGRALLFSDFLIAASAFFVFGMKIGLFSMLGLFAHAFLIDEVIESMSVCKAFFIITTSPQPVVDYIIGEMVHSATTLDAWGEYSHGGRKVVITVCRRAEGVRLRRKLREIDPDAFVIIQSTSEIIGRGFRQV